MDATKKAMDATKTTSLTKRGACVLLLLAAASTAVAIAIGPLASASASDSPVAEESTTGGGQETRLVNGVAYPVNANGQTYGGQQKVADGTVLTSEEQLTLLPDLVAVGDEHGNVGYVTKEDYVYGFVSDFDDPEEGYEWTVSDGTLDPIPIYDADGETRIGWWVTEGCEGHAEFGEGTE